MKYLLLLIAVAVSLNVGCGKKNDNNKDDYSYYNYDDDQYNPYNQSYQQLPGAYQTSGFIYCPQQGSTWNSQSFFSDCLNSNGPGIVNNGYLYHPEYFKNYIIQQYYATGSGLSFEAWFCTKFGSSSFYQGNQGYTGNFCQSNGFFNSGYQAYTGGSWNGSYVSGGITFSW